MQVFDSKTASAARTAFDDCMVNLEKAEKFGGNGLIPGHQSAIEVDSINVQFRTDRTKDHNTGKVTKVVRYVTVNATVKIRVGGVCEIDVWDIPQEIAKRPPIK